MKNLMSKALIYAYGLSIKNLILLALGLSALTAYGQTTTTKFDHTKTGFPLTGLHVYAACETCHVNGIFKGTPTDCASCHISGTRQNATSVVKPQQHFVTQLTCDTCHSTLTFTGAKFNHLGIADTSCSSCHNNINTAGKPPSHMPTQASCESCHKSTTTWRGSKPDHSLFTSATNCASCHNGSAATGKTAAHISTTLNCVSCHSVAGWKPTNWNHTQMPVANQCSTCHSGANPPADGPTANHIPYKSITGVVITNCDSCHKAGYASWNPGLFHNNVSISTQCATCHMSTSYGVTGKPSTAIHASVTGNCESCHKSTSTWAGASKPDHSLFTSATNCASCHNGSAATGKTAAHISTTLNCVSCHSVAGWKPTNWNHTQMPVANQCSTCHSGANPPADGPTANHIPYKSITGVVITNCDSCHKAGYASWNPGKFHANVSLLTQCAACHLTGSYGLTSKPATATHSTVTGNCESCHKSASSWLNVTYTHSAANAVGTGTCDTCHNGSTSAVSKPPTHIPVPVGAAKCDSCHLSQTSFASNFKMNHAVVTSATCTSCHNGSYLAAGTQGALAKPANHIPLAQLLNGAAMDCKACHSSTTSWLTEKMNHNGSLGNGSGWCKSCHATGTNYLGTAQKKSLTHNGGTSVKTDCSQSGCHRPLGTKGTAYSNWN
jgi:hypothetical protein